MQAAPDLTSRASFENWVAESVRYGDTDRQGHVNNAVFATYSESGRSAGKVDIGTAVLSVGRSSVTLGQGMFTGEQCAATSRNTVVLIDQKTRRPTPLPEEYRRALVGMAHLGEKAPQ
jgi:acyl-CoA thioester hydrolase